MTDCTPDPDDDPVAEHRSGDHDQNPQPHRCVACLMATYPKPRQPRSGQHRAR